MPDSPDSTPPAPTPTHGEPNAVGRGQESEEAARARRRVKQVFTFLKAYADLRRPLVTRASEEEWNFLLCELPDHEAIVRRPIERESDAEGVDPGPMFRVGRAEITRAPAPPASIEAWIDGEWNEPSHEPEFHAAWTNRLALGETRVEQFDDDSARPADRGRWLGVWRAWAEEERPARLARAAYETLFDIKSRLDREGEALELLFGNGWIRQRTQQGTLDYPVLLQRAELEFDPDVPEFRIRDTDREPELNVAVLQCVRDVQPQLLAKLREELDADAFHPLGETNAVAWLRSIIHQLTPHGRLLDDRSTPASAEPVLINAPVMIMRRRSSGVPEAMARALRAIEGGIEIPRSLWRITGVEDKSAADREARTLFRPLDALLSKPANDEQLDLIRQLETRGSVLVQGPPGTGKSHTIANLIGHLVATGQRVLVTSHTTKALRVLREHVVPILRPLCVSVLDNDMGGRKQLEEAITRIQSGIQRPSDRELELQDASLTARRERVAQMIDTARRDLLLIRQSECSPIVVGNEQVLPIDAAKQVRRDALEHGWIPAPIEANAPMPLSFEEVRELYASNGIVSADDEQELAKTLPNLGSLISAERLRAASDEASREVHADASKLFRAPAQPGTGVAARELAERIDAALARIAAFAAWEREVIASSLTGDARLAEWREFGDLLERTAEHWRQRRTAIIENDPRLPTAWRADDLRRVIDEMLIATTPNKHVGSIQRLLHPEWRRFMREAQVNGAEPRSHSDMAALKAALDVQVARDRLRKQWNAQTETFSLPKFEDLGPRPEEGCEPFSKDVRTALVWWSEHARPVVEQSEATAFEWTRELRASPRGTGRHAELDRHTTVLRAASAGLRARADAEQVLAARKLLREQGEHLAECSAHVARDLAEALTAADTRAWTEATDTLARLQAKLPALTLRRRLLGKIKTVAPTWAADIQGRIGVHAATVPPGDAVFAWRWRQLDQELIRRSKLDEREVSSKLEHATDEHRRVTADLIDRRTWRAIRERTGLPQQQALVGWADLMRRVGKGTGKRAPMLLAEARKKLDLARDAVPVWIMPLARVFETINPETTRFDVVIIDEASQSDVTALFALFLGARVVVVGDHEQVSPDAVGQNLDEVDKLIKQHLDAVPNALLYTGKTSIYDLARQSFPGQLRLAEHFRCVREIIEFSNRLSYNNEIRPLRESASALAPHLVEHLVVGHRGDEKLNIPEAEAVACLVAAAIEQPEYRGKSIGVVSLLGDEQAMLIDEHVRRRVVPRELADRRIVCGNAAQFQGDERDVMFLTMVDAPKEGPLSLRSQDMFKQRYNVAASRAKDQLWLIHSLDPMRDLQPDDLRYRLIQHVRDPGLLASEEARAQAATESPFEAEVVRRLVNAGYRIRTQVHVGAYRIDIVVIGDGKRVALECDGEQFHPPEALEADLARQMVLERLGWRFIRLRGSRYYRDPERAMQWVFEQLEARQIAPLGPDGWDGSVAERRGMELIDRVRRRAAELRREWFPQPE